jgi:serine/threonine-protein kinase HipA
VLVHYDTATAQMSTQPFPGSTPWLVKFQAQNEHKEVCAIEHLYAQLARDCGLAPLQRNTSIWAGAGRLWRCPL